MKARTDQSGYVHMGALLIGKVERDSGSWVAFVQIPNRLIMRNVGTFATKREAISEVVIMREV